MGKVEQYNRKSGWCSSDDLLEVTILVNFLSDMGPDNVHLGDMGPDHVQNTFTQLWNCLAFFFTSSLLIFHIIHYNTAIIFY